MTIEELRAELEKRLRARRHDQHALYVGAATGIGYEAASELSRADLNRRFIEDDYENFDRLDAEELEAFEQDNGYVNALEEILALLALGNCAECGTHGVDLDYVGADGRSVCDECREVLA